MYFSFQTHKLCLYTISMEINHFYFCSQLRSFSSPSQIPQQSQYENECKAVAIVLAVITNFKRADRELTCVTLYSVANWN